MTEEKKDTKGSSRSPSAENPDLVPESTPNSTTSSTLLPRKKIKVKKWWYYGVLAFMLFAFSLSTLSIISSSILRVTYEKEKVNQRLKTLKLLNEQLKTLKELKEHKYQMSYQMSRIRERLLELEVQYKEIKNEIQVLRDQFSLPPVEPTPPIEPSPPIEPILPV